MKNLNNNLIMKKNSKITMIEKFKQKGKNNE